MRVIVAFLMLIAALFAFWVNFNIVFDYLIVCQPYENPTLSVFQLVLYIAGIIVAILVSWLLASFDHNMMTINFCGTRLYGRMPSPTGYISTKWLVMGGLPILPVQTYEVTAESPSSGLHTSYAMNPIEKLEMGQVVRTAITGYGILLVVEAIAIMFPNWLICF